MKKIIFILGVFIIFAAVSCGDDDENTETTKEKIYDTIRTTVYDTIRNFVTDTVNVEKISYDTIRSFVTDTIWTERYVTVYDTIRITINPDGTLSNTSWVKYVINPQSNERDSVNVENGKGIYLKSDAERFGYDFVCWNTQPDGSGTTYNAGDEYYVTSHILLYAIWQSRDGLKSSELYAAI